MSQTIIPTGMKFKYVEVQDKDGKILGRGSDGKFSKLRKTAVPKDTSPGMQGTTKGRGLSARTTFQYENEPQYKSLTNMSPQFGSHWRHDSGDDRAYPREEIPTSVARRRDVSKHTVMKTEHPKRMDAMHVHIRSPKKRETVMQRFERKLRPGGTEYKKALVRFHSYGNITKSTKSRSVKSSETKKALKNVKKNL